MYIDVLTACGRIARRSDVVVTKWDHWPAAVDAWEKDLPQDMFEFYQKLNGLVFEWRFVDEEQFHGFIFHGLDSSCDYSIFTFFKKSMPIVETDAYEDGHRRLYVEGGQNRLVLKLGAKVDVFERTFLHRDASDVPQTFTEYVERGVDCGFASGWRGGDPDCRDAVTARLAEEVEPRDTFEVTLEEVDEISASQYRQSLGRKMPKGRFNKFVRALGGTQKAKEFTDEERGEAIDEITADVDALDEEQIEKALKANNAGSRLDRESFAALYRCSGEPLIKVRMHCKYLSTPDQLPLQQDSNTLERILQDHPEIDLLDGVDHHAAIWRYAYPPMVGGDFSVWRDFEFIERWKGRGDKETTAEFLLEPRHARAIRKGMSWISHALPTVTPREFRR